MKNELRNELKTAFEKGGKTWETARKKAFRRRWNLAGSALNGNAQALKEYKAIARYIEFLENGKI